MAEDDKKAAAGVSVALTPMLIEVPVLNKEDLTDLMEAIDDAQAAHIKLRSKTRAVMRKAQAALDRWSPPAPAEAAKPEGKTPLRLVGAPKKGPR